MRRHYDFSTGVRNPYAARIPASTRGAQETEEDSELAPLSKAQLRELDRRVRDSDDRTRFMIASVMSPRFVLYYDVSHDVYVMNEPPSPQVPSEWHGEAREVLTQAASSASCRTEAKAVVRGAAGARLG